MLLVGTFSLLFDTVMWPASGGVLWLFIGDLVALWFGGVLWLFVGDLVALWLLCRRVFSPLVRDLTALWLAIVRLRWLFVRELNVLSLWSATTGGEMNASMQGIILKIHDLIGRQTDVVAEEGLWKRRYHQLFKFDSSYRPYHRSGQ